MKTLFASAAASALCFAAARPPEADEPTGATAPAPETATQVTDETSEPAVEGVRARRAVMMKQFVPSVDWINRNVVAGGKGTRATVGRVFGIATGWKEKIGQLPNGDTSVSIVLEGDFQTEDFITGELGSGTNVYFPNAYAEKVKTVFISGEIRDTEGKVTGNTIRSVEVDCDVGLEATGKSIPYEWVITAFREGEEMAVLKRLRNSRKRPTQLLVSATGAPLALAAPTPPPAA